MGLKSKATYGAAVVAQASKEAQKLAKGAEIDAVMSETQSRGGSIKDARKNINKQFLSDRNWPEPYGKPEDIDAELCLEKIRRRRFEQVTRNECDALFDYFDLDKDKFISVFEIKALLDLVCGMEESEEERESLMNDLEIIFQQGDSSGDGVIDMDEMLQAMKLASSHESTKRVIRGAEERLHCWAKRENVIRFLEAEAEQSESCQSLPFYLLFFCLSFYLVVQHLKILSGYNEIRIGETAFELPQTINDDGYATYFPGNMSFRDGPLNWIHADLLENRLNLADDHPFRGRVSNYMQIIGGVMIHQDLGEYEACRDEDLQELYMPTVVTTPTNGVVTPAPPSLDTICVNIDDMTRKTEFIPVTADTNLLTMKTQVQNLAGANWVEETARNIIINVFTWNADSGFFQLNEVKFILDDGGLVKTKNRYVNYLAQPYDAKGVSGKQLFYMDAVWAGLVGYVWLREILQILSTMWRLGFRKAFSNYLNVWNAVDWFNIMMSILIMTNYYDILQYLKNLEDTLRALPTAASELKQPMLEVHAAAETAGDYFEKFKWRIAIFSTSTMLSFFKAFRANPRLNVVAATIAGAGVDLLHFLIVMLTIFMVFVLTGHFLFGGSVIWFSTVGRTVNTCFLCMMGWLFDDIRDDCADEAGATMSMVYWMCFFLVLTVLLFNMILAIIFDVYTEVKDEAGDAEFLWTQVGNILSEQKKKAMMLKELRRAQTNPNVSTKRVPRAKVLGDMVEKDYHEDDICTPESMVTAWGNKFSKASATVLLRGVEQFVINERGKATVNTADVMRLCGRMDMNTREMMARARFEVGDPVLFTRQMDAIEASLDQLVGGRSSRVHRTPSDAGEEEKNSLAQLEEQESFWK